MAASSLLTLLDDIASVLDDVAVLSKVAAKKSAGVLGDDLALNAQQVTGVRAAREVPVVLAVAKGSLRNKAILVPAALAIGHFAPWAITPLLMAGGVFLCYEGVEKLAHRAGHNAAEPVVDPADDLQTVEQAKIKGAIRTDFILSAEIIVIALGAAAGATFITQVGVLVGIALLMTVGVYGLVAGIVKLDDAGLWLSRRAGSGLASLQRGAGRAILVLAPYLMKALSIVGTAAMFLVGGGILTHGVPVVGHGIESLAQRLAASVGTLGSATELLAPMLLNGLVGLVAGAIALGVVTLIRKLLPGNGKGATTAH